MNDVCTENETKYVCVLCQESLSNISEDAVKHLKGTHPTSRVCYYSTMPITETPLSRGLGRPPLRSQPFNTEEMIKQLNLQKSNCSESFPQTIENNVNTNLKPKNSSSPAVLKRSSIRLSLNEEKERLLDKNDKKSSRSDIHIMSSASDIVCPVCGGKGPFICSVCSKGNIFCSCNCLVSILPFLSCCLPEPSWQAYVRCSRCKHQLLKFDSSESWLLAK